MVESTRPSHSPPTETSNFSPRRQATTKKRQSTSPSMFKPLIRLTNPWWQLVSMSQSFLCRQQPQSISLTNHTERLLTFHQDLTLASSVLLIASVRSRKSAFKRRKPSMSITQWESHGISEEAGLSNQTRSQSLKSMFRSNIGRRLETWAKRLRRSKPRQKMCTPKKSSTPDTFLRTNGNEEIRIKRL